MIRLTVLYCVAVTIASAQSAAEPKSFDVATVKQAGESAGNGLRLDRCTGGPGATDPSLYTCRGLSLKTLIEIAYGLPSASISAPAWMESERYDIVAKPPAGATATQMPAMLQALLEERFSLRVERETKSHSVYALVASHGAGKLKPSSDQPEDPAEAQARGRAAGERRRAFGPGVSMMHIDDRKMSLGALATLLSSRLDRPVQDMTGIAGTFWIQMDFAMNAVPASADGAPHPPTVFEAVQDQLGLRLEARKGSVDTLVVAGALKKPREN